MTKGERIQKVVLTEKSVVTNDYNEPVESWNPAANYPSGEIYTEWWDQGGQETLEGGQIVAVKDIRIRPVENLNVGEGTHRIERDGQAYDIENVKEIGRNRQIIMLKLVK